MGHGFSRDKKIPRETRYLWKKAKQTVFGGGGGAKPKVILVGEQPGDQEDLPF
jgi:uracil-DNA glycosylase